MVFDFGGRRPNDSSSSRDLCPSVLRIPAVSGMERERVGGRQRTLLLSLIENFNVPKGEKAGRW